MLDSKIIRQRYLDFFAKRSHAVISSASLIPEGDSTLLFTNSGMFPLVPYLLGERHPAGARLVNSQKCVRTEDIEEVGDGRHNTFFEMIGNWSLGDYFKKEQLNWWYEFLIEDLGLDPRRLYQTVYAGGASAPRDEESVGILKEIFTKYNIEAAIGPETTGKGSIGPGVEIDFSRVRIMAYRDDKNWWKRGDAIGELGGPDSETFYDTGKPHDRRFGEFCHLNCDCGRFLEIGNSVFMQYQKTPSGWVEMKNKNVDFGGGFERIVMVVNGFDNIYETDLFAPIIGRIEILSDKKYADNPRVFEIISDHLKAASFIMGDDRGIAPGNSGQNYIVRRLVRRAVRFGRSIGITEPDWTSKIAGEVVDIYGEIYPELIRNRDFIMEELHREEEKFAASLERGLKKFDEISSLGALSGKDAFDLYQSYGFPVEITEELTREKGISFDKGSFDEELAKHQELSRTLSAGVFKSGLGDTSEKTVRLHTATHLTLAALRNVLGDHVVQKGSNITPERLRLDFNHPSKLTDAEISRVESIVNGWIKSDFPISFEEMDLEEARRRNAMGVFSGKYGERVKVYRIGTDSPISYEICSGPHVSRTSEIGNLKITKEEAVSSGVRRVKAVIE